MLLLVVGAGVCRMLLLYVIDVCCLAVLFASDAVVVCLLVFANGVADVAVVMRCVSMFSDAGVVCWLLVAVVVRCGCLSLLLVVAGWSLLIVGCW